MLTYTSEAFNIRDAQDSKVVPPQPVPSRAGDGTPHAGHPTCPAQGSLVWLGLQFDSIATGQANALSLTLRAWVLSHSQVEPHCQVLGGAQQVCSGQAHVTLAKSLGPGACVITEASHEALGPGVMKAWPGVTKDRARCAEGQGQV